MSLCFGVRASASVLRPPCGLGGAFSIAPRSRRLDIEASLQVVGGCGEMDLGSGAGEASPSHASQAVAAFHVPKIFSMRARTRWIGAFHVSSRPNVAVSSWP
jgi:hypothetical protein